MSSCQATTTLPAWPPALPEEAKAYLTSQATDYAMAHGIVYRPVASSSSVGPTMDSVIHAPFSLLPSPFPRSAFELAQKIQPMYDTLYAGISSNHAFLEKVIGQNVIQVDEFQKSLWDIYLNVKDDLVQPLSLGLFRSDYLLHDQESESTSVDDDAGLGSRKGDLTLKQVEFNTISASFGALCTKVNQLHRHISKTTAYLNSHEGLENQNNLPSNEALNVLAGGLEAAHRAYLEQQGYVDPKSKDNVTVLFVVQPGERNAFDQRHIEYALQAKGVKVLRQTFTEIGESMKSLSSSQGRKLILSHPVLGEVEVSVVYFRAGYGPSDYPTSVEWEIRKNLERSAAIKCPTIATQLAGAKKVQQVLAEPNILEEFIPDVTQTNLLRETFSDLYPLDSTSELGRKGYELAMNESHKFVLKPQREGGGNNVYRSDIPPFLRQLENNSSGDKGALEKRNAYILMSLIKPPSGLGNYLVKANTSASANQAIQHAAVLAKDTVSELGVYGAILWQDSKVSGGTTNGIDVKFHKSGGYLLRTKGRESDEGGVAVGFSVIDSVFLI